MINLNDLRLFVQAVESGGFSAASRRLGIPKSTLSKRVAELEAGLEARLIQRTSRRFALTELGLEFFEHARGALIEAESAEDVVRRRVAEPSGTVRITASIPTAQAVLADHLPAIARLLPKVRLDVHATDRFVDLVHEGFDIAIRSHFGPLPDSALVQRRIAVESVLLVGAPDYFLKRDQPRHPSELDGHDGLLTSAASTTWRLRSEIGDVAEVRPIPVFAADESEILLKAAVAGLGIAGLPETICRDAVERGDLMRVLPTWGAGVVTTTMLSPHRRGQLPAVRAVADLLFERLR